MERGANEGEGGEEAGSLLVAAPDLKACFTFLNILIEDLKGFLCEFLRGRDFEGGVVGRSAVVGTSRVGVINEVSGGEEARMRGSKYITSHLEETLRQC